MSPDEAKRFSTATARRVLKRKFGRYATFERLTAYTLAKVDELEAKVVELELKLAKATKPAAKPVAKSAAKKK